MRTPLDQLARQIVAEELHIPIGTVFRLNEIADAHRRLAESRAGGKIVVLT